MNMQTLLSMRHVGPFREPVQEQLTALSDTADTLELWIKVQLLWTALESVFMGMYAVRESQTRRHALEQCLWRRVEKIR